MDKQRRKELVSEYQEQERQMGVYRIINSSSGRCLIDSSLNLQGAWQRDQFMLGSGMHANRELQREWTAAGGEGFTFELLQVYDPGEKVRFDYQDVQPKDEAPRSDLNRKYKKGVEQLMEQWLQKLQPYGEKGYNIPKK